MTDLINLRKLFGGPISHVFVRASKTLVICGWFSALLANCAHDLFLARQTSVWTRFSIKSVK